MMKNESSRDLSAKAAVEGLRSNTTNGELMQQFKISPKGFADLLRQLYEKKLITDQDMLRRGIKFKVAPKGSTASSQPEEEFLDTVELTELLSFKSTETPATASKSENVKPDAPKNQSAPRKKAGFKLNKLFRRRNKISLLDR